MTLALNEALTLEGLDTPWQVRTRFDSAAITIADRHYSRRRGKIGSNQVGGVGRVLTLVSPCERALWVTRYMQRTMDGLDSFRNSYFRNEGAGLSSELICEAVRITEALWPDRPADAWVTWIDTRKVKSANPRYCFKRAGWVLDREWPHPYLIRLRLPWVRP